MEKTFAAKYLGGVVELKESATINLVINDFTRQITIEKSNIIVPIFFEDIIEVSYNDKKISGNAAKGALIGGVLSGGIGILAGAAIAGRKKEDSVITMSYLKNEKKADLLIKPIANAENLFAFLSSSLLVNSPLHFNRDMAINQLNAEKEEKQKGESQVGCYAFVIIAVIAIILFAINYFSKK